MKKVIAMLAAAVIAAAGSFSSAASRKGDFIRVSGVDLVDSKGAKFYIRGINLGNWLNPEGYMFGFEKTNSPRFIHEMLCQMAGEDAAAEFWEEFKNNYITREDVDFIARCGANTIRLPFHYKLFTDEDYMGRSSGHDPYRYIDALVEWCRANRLRLILDMHDCPGGQTGDNIDDSYGFPWLFESARAQNRFIKIWEEIAARYSSEPVILGYELMNEPIAHYFDSGKGVNNLNNKLEPLYKRAVAAIRKHDRNHVIILGAPQWNSNFEPFTDWHFDNNIMYTCHRYGGPATADAIRSYIDFRNLSGVPMYMGELGHNTDQWQLDFANALEDNNIGYTFWPYKKIESSCMNAVAKPSNWELVIGFSESDRSSYAKIRENRPDTALTRCALRQFIRNSRFENCTPQQSYIRSIKLVFSH